jgi:hypothetical protein
MQSMCARTFNDGFGSNHNTSAQMQNYRGHRRNVPLLGINKFLQRRNRIVGSIPAEAVLTAAQGMTAPTAQAALVQDRSTHT